MLAECGHENASFSRQAVYVLAPPQLHLTFTWISFLTMDYLNNAEVKRARRAHS
jgi:hypothetical protein